MNEPPASAISITLYGLQTCAHCRAARERLEASGRPFEMVYVDLLLGEERSDTLRRVKRLNPALSFPTLVIGKTVIVGHKPAEIDAALNLLSR